MRFLRMKWEKCYIINWRENVNDMPLISVIILCYNVENNVDLMPDIFGVMKNAVLEYFPNYKANKRLEKCNKREKLLLQMLVIQKELSVEDMLRIKLAYLKTMTN